MCIQIHILTLIVVIRIFYLPLKYTSFLVISLMAMIQVIQVYIYAVNAMRMLYIYEVVVTLSDN